MAILTLANRRWWQKHPCYGDCCCTDADNDRPRLSFIPNTWQGQTTQRHGVQITPQYNSGCITPQTLPPNSPVAQVRWKFNQWWVYLAGGRPGVWPGDKYLCSVTLIGYWLLIHHPLCIARLQWHPLSLTPPNLLLYRPHVITPLSLSCCRQVQFPVVVLCIISVRYHLIHSQNVSRDMWIHPVLTRGSVFRIFDELILQHHSQWVNYDYLDTPNHHPIHFNPPRTHYYNLNYYDRRLICF